MELRMKQDTCFGCIFTVVTARKISLQESSMLDLKKQNEQSNFNLGGVKPLADARLLPGHFFAGISGSNACKLLPAETRPGPAVSQIMPHQGPL